MMSMKLFTRSPSRMFIDRPSLRPDQKLTGFDRMGRLRNDRTILSLSLVSNSIGDFLIELGIL
jgi:hypothetical protein